MATASATVKMDENGRITIPIEAREKLGVDGEEALLDLDITYEPGAE